jgi:hypothetical protein
MITWRACMLTMLLLIKRIPRINQIIIQMSKAKLELSFTHKKAHKTLIMIVVRTMMTRNLKGLLLKKRPLHLMKTNCRRYLVTPTFL